MNSLPQHCSKYHSNVDQSQGSHVLLSTGRENRTCLFQAHRPLFYSFPLGLHYADGLVAMVIPWRFSMFVTSGLLCSRGSLFSYGFLHRHLCMLLLYRNQRT